MALLQGNEITPWKICGLLSYIHVALMVIFVGLIWQSRTLHEEAKHIALDMYQSTQGDNFTFQCGLIEKIISLLYHSF